MKDHLTKRSFHYFDHPLKHKYWSLLKHRSLFFVATGLMGLFLPIYLLTEGNLSVVQIATLYGAASVAYLLLLPHMRHVINGLHIQASLVGAVIFFALYLATLAYGVPHDISLVILAFIFLIGFRFLYFTPYISEFVTQTEGGQTTRQVGLVAVAKMFTSIISPLVAGLIVSYYSYNVLYGVALFFMLLSIAPLLSLGKEKHIHFDWSSQKVWNNYKKFLKTKPSYAYMALGAETFIILFIWPLVLYKILDGNILLVGIVATGVAVIMLIIQALIAKLMDTKLSRHRSAFISIPLGALGWLAKIFVASTGGLILVSVYHDFTKLFSVGAISSLETDAIRETKDYLDEHIAVRDMYIHTGRILAAIFVVMLVGSGISIQATLWIAVIASFLQILFLKGNFEITPLVKKVEVEISEEETEEKQG